MIFTSHDRHFMKQVATCIIEVRDGHVTNYRGDYESYLYSVNKEIEDGEREQATQRMSKAPVDRKGAPAAKKPRSSGRDLQKELRNVERSIATLDTQKRAANDKLLQSTDPDEALKLHNEVMSLAARLGGLEEEWCRINAELEGDTA